ncbi:CLIP-associating protein 1-like [Crotalus adamanteus]|uniref:CLIP-associating protein 1-like n=1 Tax=Crotalus adamanteus TaxID=8729 RepID=A0AAW1B323_CROAD
MRKQLVQGKPLQELSCLVRGFAGSMKVPPSPQPRNSVSSRFLFPLARENGRYCSLRISTDLEQDQQRLDTVMDELTGWVNSSNYKVSLLGLELLGAFSERLLGRFKTYVGTVLVVLMDRMGDAKDQVREQALNLILKLMDHVAPPMFIWERLAAGFKHKNYRSREGVCLCLVATLNAYGAHSLILSKLVPHLCLLSGDSNSQVRDAAILALVEIYRHVGEKVRIDLNKRGIPAARLQTIFMKFDEVKNSDSMISSSISGE